MHKDIILFLEKIEEYLLKTNIHTDIVKTLMNNLSRAVLKKDLKQEEIINFLKQDISFSMKKFVRNFNIEVPQKPYVMLICGVNGSGKTTTIGKMANLLQSYGWNILVAGCDTYRAGANKQLADWVAEPEKTFFSDSNNNGLPSKIAVDAYNKAKKDDKDILMIDTSGRTQNNADLMSELLKIKQKLKKTSIHIPHDTVLVIDANCGYNALEQADMYNSLIGITGIIATKFDIVKNPGILMSVCKKLNVPVYGVSDGEEKDKIHDLDCDKFADLVLSGLDEIL